MLLRWEVGTPVTGEMFKKQQGSISQKSFGFYCERNGKLLEASEKGLNMVQPKFQMEH